MIKDAVIIEADECEDLDAILLNYKVPSDDEIHHLLWGIAPGQLLTSVELTGATIGERVNE